MPEPPLCNVYLLGNPASGRGRGAKALARVTTLLEARGIKATVLQTGGPTDAIRLARQAAESEAELLLVIGGDGTIRDVAEGVISAPGATTVGILPAGTGNDLARTLGIPTQLVQAVEVALTGDPLELDVWRWNDTPFVNIAGVGLDAAVAGAVNRKFRNLHGPLAYVAGALYALPRFQPFPLTLQLPDGEWSGTVWLAAFASGKCYGGGMQIAPNAAPDDGLLDIVVVEETSRIELLRQLPGLFSGRHVTHPKVRSVRAAAVEVHAPPQEVTLDGELLGTTPARVWRDTTCLRVRVPRTGA
jgi:YegS/Rv2252/BmrU family lipid kinase